MVKKILFIDGNLNTGGAERILITLIRNAHKYGCEAEVVITGKPGSMCALLPNKVKVTYMNISRSRYAFWALAKYIHKSKPDSVFSVSYTSALAAVLARPLSGHNYRIVVRHCLMPKHLIENGYLNPKSVGTKISNLLVRKIDCVVPEHKYMQQEMLEVYGNIYKGLHYVLNPLDIDLIEEQRKEKVDFPVGQINIVTAGRIDCKVKGFDYLIQSFAKVVKENKHFHLYIIGMDAFGEQAELEKMAEKLGCGNNVHFEGFQSNPYKYFEAADLYVLSSKFEASPNVVFENLYMGNRIVATSCSPILNDVLGNNGRLVKYLDTEEMAQAILNWEKYDDKSLIYSKIEDFFKVIAND